MMLRRILRRVLIGFGVLVGALVIYLAVLVATTPCVDHLRTENPTRTSYMRLRAEQRGTDAVDRVDWIDLGDISPLLACAVVKAEDGNFFRHSGFEWGEIRHALWSNIRGRSRRGASTITQQLARNLYLTPDRSVHRKLREAFITRRLEKTLDKRRILELYLNVAEWGDGVWGIKQAARVYFGRLPSELEPFEMAFLASLLPAPRAELRGRNRQRALWVQQRVLYKMLVSGLIDSDRYADAIKRARAVSSSLARGGTLQEALAAARATNGSDAASVIRLDIERVEPAQALTTECGLAQELASRTTRLAGVP